VIWKSLKAGSHGRILSDYGALSLAWLKSLVPQGVRKIKGGAGAYRIRVGDFRIVYDVYDSDKLVLILQVVRRTETTYR
jgi:mRNA-degrading endonuclease RelE of RelBE toxin-antitoxin system